MTSYQIPAEDTQCRIEVKRSRFIAFVRHTPTINSAKNFIQSLKNKYPDARHHCYGFIAGAPWESNGYGFSDDNEPSGTAGMPIFNHLKHNDIGEITIVVVRYFGGIKLGTGGLARAYSDAAKAVLDILSTKKLVKMEKKTLTIDFAQEAKIRQIIEQSEGTILNAQYKQRVTLEFEIPQGKHLTLPYSVSSP